MEMCVWGVHLHCPPPPYPPPRPRLSVKFRSLTGCVALEKWFNLSEPSFLS